MCLLCAKLVYCGIGFLKIESTYFFKILLFTVTNFCAYFKKPTPSQINLIKNEKMSFFTINKNKKNTASAQL